MCHGVMQIEARAHRESVSSESCGDFAARDASSNQSDQARRIATCGATSSNKAARTGGWTDSRSLTTTRSDLQRRSGFALQLHGDSAWRPRSLAKGDPLR
jgi:hypothetical protein